ncbi:GGDEF domain-containing protein [Mycolicibacterium anyangense]|uniref:GGDEF domain-containing protein n=1 Tax=Mycolicibacterium anyangense TaxID=1431246 RepID=UPI0013D1A756|nr:GGDEF domain-containing protein [Mycolicibacterium anyangense]
MRKRYWGPYSVLDEELSVAEDVRRLRLLIDRLPALIGYWDRDRCNLLANRTYVEYFGQGRGEIRGMHMREILGAELYATLETYVDAVLEGNPQVFTTTLIDPLGRPRQFDASYIPDIIAGEIRGFYCHAVDITDRVEAERERDAALRLFQISMANAPFGEAVLTTSGRVLRVNPALCHLLGYRFEEMAGADYRTYVHPADVATGENEMASLLSGAVQQISSERRYVRCDGSVIWLQRTAVLAPGAEYGADDVVIAQFQDVTARRCAEAELARLAVTDHLTGLHNRHALVSRIDEHRAVAPGAPVGIVFVDLDGFKRVNDEHGHAAGDDVLAEVAQRLKSAVLQPNSVFRLGGDEFIVLAPAADETSVVAGLAQDVCTVLTGRYAVGPVDVTLSASVGWTWGPTDDLEELIRRADADMYRHKARLHRPAQR